MEIKIVNSKDLSGFEPHIVAFMREGELVGEIAYKERVLDRLTDVLEQREIEYVAGPLSKTIALTNIASLNDLRKLV